MIGLALALSLLLQPATDEKGFEKLFNGKDLTGFTFVLEDKAADPAKTFSVKDGEIVVAGHPNGYMVTAKSYKEFTLRFDWRYARPEGLKSDAEFTGNSGYLLFITGERTVWPRSIEVQGMNRDVGTIIPIPKELKVEFTVDEAAQKKAAKPVGEWNTMEIVVKGGTITAIVNGVKTATVTKYELTEGPIGFQSEGAEIHWRNIRIKANEP